MTQLGCATVVTFTEQLPDVQIEPVVDPCATNNVCALANGSWTADGSVMAC
jgi:hypothetical protein